MLNLVFFKPFACCCVLLFKFLGLTRIFIIICQIIIEALSLSLQLLLFLFGGMDMTDKIGKSRKSKMKKTPDDVEAMKLEIAEELGLLPKVQKLGWAGLTAIETGRMGGILTQRKKKLKMEATSEASPPEE